MKPDHVASYLHHLESKRCGPAYVARSGELLRDLASSLSGSLLEATEEDLVQYFQARYGKRSPSTLNGKMSMARCFYRYLVKRRVLVDSPMRFVENAKVPDRAPVYLRDSQLEAVLGVLSLRGLAARRENAIVRMLYTTGVRAGELVALDWDHLDLEAGTIRVFGKGSRERLVVMTGSLRVALESWREVHPTGDGAVFVTADRRGQRLSYVAVRTIVGDAVARAGLDPRQFTAHKFRHTFATRLVNRSVPITTVQKLLGHRKLDTTTLYAHTIVDDDLRAAVNLL